MAPRSTEVRHATGPFICAKGGEMAPRYLLIQQFQRKRAKNVLRTLPIDVLWKQLARRFLLRTYKQLMCMLLIFGI